MPVALSASPLQLLALPRQSRHSQRSAFVRINVPERRGGGDEDVDIGLRRVPRAPPLLPPRSWSVDVREVSWDNRFRLPLSIGGSDAIGHQDGTHHHHHLHHQAQPEAEAPETPDLLGDILPPLATVFVVFVSALMAVRLIRVITRTEGAGDEPIQQDFTQMALEVPGATPFRPFTGRGYRLEPAAKPVPGARREASPPPQGNRTAAVFRAEDEDQASGY